MPFVLRVLGYNAVKASHSEIIFTESLEGLFVHRAFSVAIKGGTAWKKVLSREANIRVDLIEIIIDSCGPAGVLTSHFILVASYVLIPVLA
jgi:cellulose biosynthesis protein BcsQ